jgi:predicted Rossmann fold nucleotide-binding protein DprA/Smf involved in DNA uptake
MERVVSNIHGGAEDDELLRVRHLVSPADVDLDIRESRVACIGTTRVLLGARLGLFCSIKCPGELILKLIDLAKELRDRGVGVISGFHAPMDKECFDILLRGKGPIAWCPARSIDGMRLRPEHKKAILERRLFIFSPFTENRRRISEQMAERRNEVVVTFAQRVFVAYAEPGGKTEHLSALAVSIGKPVYTFESKYNANLMKLGAKVATMDEIAIVEGRAE